MEDNKRIMMNDHLKSQLKTHPTIPYDLIINGKIYHPQEYVGAGSKGVVWFAKGDSDGDYAIKFAISEDYEDRSYLQEASLARKLIGYTRFASFIDVGTTNIHLPDNSDITLVCFIEEWVEGPTLDEFLTCGNVTVGFLKGFIGMMCEALNILKVKGLCHDDLRPSNIKIAPPKPGILNIYEMEVKIIDTGSLKKIERFKKDTSDHQWFVMHIVCIRNYIYKKKNLTRADKYFLKDIIPLLNRMLDEDPHIALIDPKKIIEQFELTWMESNFPKMKEGSKLHGPFHYISAETIKSDQLLVELFAESCPWKNDVCSPDPLVLTGPRGCGKSTIFRRLSLKGMLYKGIEEIQTSPIVGFYISCSCDLKNRVNWIRNDNLARRFRGEIIHYFNLLISREIVNTLKYIAIRLDRELLFGFGKHEEERFYQYIIEKTDDY